MTHDQDIEHTDALVPPEDSAALAKEILHFASDIDLRRVCSVAARKVAVEEYSLKMMMDTYQRMYCDEIDDRGNG